MTLVELMVAISILAIVMSGLALSIGIDYKAVALARARQVAESIANQRLEELRDVDYDTMALSSQPVHSTDPANPDYYVEHQRRELRRHRHRPERGADRRRSRTVRSITSRAR